MSERETIRMALLDAADWQRSLGLAYQAGAPERTEAFNRAAKYMKLYNKRYGERRSDAMFKDAKLVSIYELRAQHLADDKEQP